MKSKLKVGGGGGAGAGVRLPRPGVMPSAGPAAPAPASAPDLDIASLPVDSWAPEPASVPGGPVSVAALEKMLNRIQAKDQKRIFLHPVTDAIVSQIEGDKRGYA